MRARHVLVLAAAAVAGLLIGAPANTPRLTVRAPTGRGFTATRTLSRAAAQSSGVP